MAISLGGFSGGGGTGAVTSVNGQTGVVVVSGDDVAADHTASNYTAAHANVDGHLSGIDSKLGTLAAGLTYKGAFNATAGTPSIVNALQGDLYVVDTAGTIYGQTWAIGDHLLINANMGGVIDNASIDKIDNTDQVTSVNGSTGAVTLSGDDLAADHTASNYTAANANIDGHLSGIDSKFGTLGTASTAASTDFLQVSNNLSDLNNAITARSNLGLGTAATSASTDFLASTAGGDDIAADHTAVNYTAANANIDGHLSGIDTALGATASPTLDGVTTNGNTTTNAINVGTITTSGDILANAADTRTIGAEATRFITYYGDMNGAIRFKAKNDEGSAITKGQVLYIKGISGSVPTVGLADANDSNKMQAFGLAAANANDQAEVQVVTFGNLTDFDTSSFSAGDTVYVSTTAGALTATAPTGESSLIQNIGFVLRSDASAGIIKVGGAGRTNATPNLNQNKIFLGNGSNQAVSTALSSIALSSFNNDLTFPVTSVNGSTGAVTLSGDDVAADHTASNYTAANANVDGHLSGIDTKFGTLGTASTAASTDFLSATGADTLGGNLDVGTSDIVSSSNNNIEFAANGTGVVKVIPTATGGHLELNGDGTNVGKLRLMCEQSSHGIYLTGPSHAASASYTLKFPDTTGTNNYVLKTDGSGNLDWVAQSGGGSAPSVTTDSSGTDTTISTSTGIEEIHLIDNGASAVVITLPAVATAGTGYKYNIKRLGSGTVTIDANGSETIDGSANFAIGAQNDSITLVAVVQSGTDTWFLI